MQSINNCLVCEQYGIDKKICSCRLKMKKNTYHFSHTYNNYILKYFVDANFLRKLKKTFESNEANGLFVIKEGLPTTVLCKENGLYVLPIGLFSNIDFPLECLHENIERIIVHKMNSQNLINTITLKPIQKHIIDTVYKTFIDIQKTNPLSICYVNIIAQCSIGKTVMAIYIICDRKMKTFVVTPTIELCKQWFNEINKFVKNIKTYVSTQGVNKFLSMTEEELKDIDVLFFPSKHLSNIDFVNYLIKNYSIGIFDEQHTYNLHTHETLRKFLTVTSFPMVISLTATPRKYNSFYFGRQIDVEHIIKQYEKPKFSKILYKVETDNFISFPKPVLYHQYLLSLSKNLTKKERYLQSTNKKKLISTDYNRINCIVKTILEDYKRPDAKIIILVKFVNEIEMYKNCLTRAIQMITKIQRLGFTTRQEMKESILKKRETENYNLKNNISFTNNDELVITDDDILNEEINDESNDEVINEFEKTQFNIFTLYSKGSGKESDTNLNMLKPSLLCLSKYILIGTTDLLGTGIDVVELNSLHLSCVTGNENNLIQYAGRVSRTNETVEHYFYFYNINSYSCYKIDRDIGVIAKTLKKKDWELQKKECKNINFIF